MGRHALIFGISGAIGSAMCDHTLSQGWDVTGIGRRKARQADIESLVADMKDEDSLETALTSLARPVDAVLFAQGYQPTCNLDETSMEHIRNMFDTHVAGTLVALKYLKPHLVQGGVVTLVSSVAANKGSYDASYAAAKGAVSSLVCSLTRELFGLVRVNAVAPGLIKDSPVHRSMNSTHVVRHLERMFAHRLITAQEVAATVWHLWENPYINGTVVAVDGGYV